MLSHDRFRTPPLLRTDSTQWHTTGQLWMRWFFSLADGARVKPVSRKTCHDNRPATFPDFEDRGFADLAEFESAKRDYRSNTTRRI